MEYNLIQYKESDFKDDDGVVQIVKNAIFGLSVCRSKTLSNEEVVQRANAMHPCGTTAGWMWPSDDFFESYPNTKAVQCAEHSDREHVWLTC